MSKRLLLLKTKDKLSSQSIELNKFQSFSKRLFLILSKFLKHLSRKSMYLMLYLSLYIKTRSLKNLRSWKSKNQSFNMLKMFKLLMLLLKRLFLLIELLKELKKLRLKSKKLLINWFKFLRLFRLKKLLKKLLLFQELFRLWLKYLKSWRLQLKNESKFLKSLKSKNLLRSQSISRNQLKLNVLKTFILKLRNQLKWSSKFQMLFRKQLKL